MTVIAFKDGTMAADTRVSFGNEAIRATKLVRMQDGGVAGGCGLWSAAYAALRYLETGGPYDDEHANNLPNIKDACILIARPDGSLWLLEDRFPAYPILDKSAAFGCGSAAAIMAMRLGQSAPAAVAQVTRQDILCGDPVQSMAVEQTHEYAALKTHPKRSPPAKKKR